MATYLVCEGVIDTTAFTCSTGWTTSQVVDFHDLVALLQFDPEIFAILFGTCVLCFVIGHFAGHVARNLARK